MSGRLRDFLDFHTDLRIVSVLHILHLRPLVERFIKAIETMHAVELRVHWVGPQVDDGLPITLLLLFATLLYINAHDRCGHYVVFLDNRASDRVVIHVITYMIIYL